MERTGKEQRRPGVIHADDVRDYLLRHPNIRPEFIAVKTSQKDELRDVDEIGGLLSAECPIRFIITKQALQEGWDCAFAYVLTILTNPSSKSALTQLVGRILRQPYARKTHVSALERKLCLLLPTPRHQTVAGGAQGIRSRRTARYGRQDRRRRGRGCRGDTRGDPPAAGRVSVGYPRPGLARIHDPGPSRMAARALRIRHLESSTLGRGRPSVRCSTCPLGRDAWTSKCMRDWRAKR